MSATGRPTDRQSGQYAYRTPDRLPGGEETGRTARRDGYTEAPLPRQRCVAVSPATGPVPFTLLVVGDDPTGSFAGQDLLDARGDRVRIRCARNLTEAQRLLTADVSCVLFDLDLGLTALHDMLRLSRTTALVALASHEDHADLAAEAVRLGAQDYLFRADLDASLLNRAMRYAVERKRADLAQLQLTESRLLTHENARLARGLLPTPLLDSADELRFAARYRPGRSRALLGGDFYDVVRTPDGVVHAMIGDVCGHGPDEAALGVELRIAWRALTFAGLGGNALLGTLQQVMEHERPDDEIFATLCSVDIAPGGRRASLCLAGHPAPLLARPGHPAELLPDEENGPALGLPTAPEWPCVEVELGEVWSLMLYTDGLIEGRTGQGSGRLGQDGLLGLVDGGRAAELRGEKLLDAAVTGARDLNGGELTDDVAVVLLERGQL